MAQSTWVSSQRVIVLTRAGQSYIVPIWCGAWQPLPYIYLPILVIHLYTFDMEHITCLGPIFQYKFNCDVFLWLDYLIWKLFGNAWYVPYHICLGLIFSIQIWLWCFYDQTTLFGNHFKNSWYETYHTCPGLVFNVNSTVMFVCDWTTIFW